MSYKVRQKGYEYKGFQLGEKCIYKGKEYTIIGFDERNHRERNFIVININTFERGMNISPAFVTSILEGYETSNFRYVGLNDIQLTKGIVDYDNQISSISLIHIPDILEDVIQEDEIIDIEKIKLCIDSLRKYL